ncbi:MAG: hemerythrin domain-containing protein [Myxococcaceae bacterium]
MNALKLLMEDHRTVDALFKRFEQAGDNAHREKKRIAARIIKELSIHASIEEQFLYPAARDRDPRLDNQVLEALEEHHVAKWTLDELERMSAEDERFDAKVTVLMESIRHHVEEEEEELFPKLQKVIGEDELEALGAVMEQAKKVAPTHPHPMAPDTPPGNVIAGALASVLDSGRDFARTLKLSAAKAAKTVRSNAQDRLAQSAKDAKNGFAKRARAAKKQVARRST